MKCLKILVNLTNALYFCMKLGSLKLSFSIVFTSTSLTRWLSARLQFTTLPNMMTSSNGNIFPRYWPFVRGIHRFPVNSPHKGQWRRALMFSVICNRIHGRVINGEAGDLRHHRTHYDVTVMKHWHHHSLALSRRTVPIVPVSHIMVLLTTNARFRDLDDLQKCQYLLMSEVSLM